MFKDYLLYVAEFSQVLEELNRRGTLFSLLHLTAPELYLAYVDRLDLVSV